MCKSCCRRHDDPAVLRTAVKVGQSTPGSSDRDTEGGVGVEPAMDTLEPGDVQSVKHEEATLRRAKSHLHRWPPYPTELWKPRKKRLRWGLWAGADQTRLQDVARSWEKMHARERTRARARRENDEVDVDCRNTPEDIHHTLVANNDVECMLAQVEGYSRNRKLDELWCGRGHSWNALWSRPQADDGMPIRLSEALKCRGAVGKGRFQLARCAAKRDPLTSARGRIKLSIRTETPYESSGQKPRVDTARAVWQAVESDIDDTKRRIGEILE